MNDNHLMSELESSIEKALTELAQAKIELRKKYTEKSKFLGEEFANFVEKNVHYRNYFKNQLEILSAGLNLTIENTEENKKEYVNSYHKIEELLNELGKEALLFHDSFKQKSNNILLDNINNLENEISTIKNETKNLENEFKQYSEEHNKISKLYENALDLAEHYSILSNISRQNLEKNVKIFVSTNQFSLVNQYEIIKSQAFDLTNPGPSLYSKKVLYSLSQKKFEMAFPNMPRPLLYKNNNLIFINKDYLYEMNIETNHANQINISRGLSNVVHFNADFDTNVLYFFGRNENARILNDCFSYSLDSLHYRILTPVPENLYRCCSAVIRSEMRSEICITGMHSEKIYFYNILEDTYAYAQRYEFMIEKLVFSHGNDFYLLYGSSIMKLKEKRPNNHYCFKFKKSVDLIVGPNDELQSYIVFHGRYFYFILSGRVMRFDYLHYRVKEVQRLVR